MAKPVFQNHHIIYPSEKNKEVTGKIRRGVHAALTWLRRFNHLTEEEILVLEAELALLKLKANGSTTPPVCKKPSKQTK